MATVRTIDDLTALYDEPVASSIIKEVDRITPLHRAYIDASPFVVVASSGPGGLDCSPRGDPAGFIRVVDERTLHLPDRRGNNRLDTLRNLVVDPRIGLLFLIPGIGVTLRVNGTAVLSTDDDLLDQHTITASGRRCRRRHDDGRLHPVPEGVDPLEPVGSGRYRTPDELPSVGQINELITAGALDGAAFDAAYPQRLRETIY